MTKTIVFCGSFKFYKEMEKASAVLRKAGLKVVVPKPSHIRYGHKPEEFKGKYNKATIKKWEGEEAISHLESIRKSDAIYVYNKRSYIGPAVTVEIGYALALHKPIYAKAELEDITLSNYLTRIISPRDLVKEFK